MTNRAGAAAVAPATAAPGGTAEISTGPITALGSGSGTADQRREQMLRAALDVINERGYPDTRIADVAERIGISPALVIYYFKTKDQLLTEAIRYSEDSWYDSGQRRMAGLPTAAARLEEFVAMMCLPEADPEPSSSTWLIWLDFWAQAARNPEVAAVRQKSDERWRQAIGELIQAGQQADEFRALDHEAFAIRLSALLDGLAVQIALADPVVTPLLAFELAMEFVAEQLGFAWTPGRGHPVEPPTGLESAN
jgi:AcrR family transcriptional regulator